MLPQPGKSSRTSPALPRTTRDAGVAAGDPPADRPTAWKLVATPHVLRFPQTELGAISAPMTVTLANRGATPLDIESLDFVRHGGVGEPARPGELELVQGKPGQVLPSATMTVEIVFRPTRVVGQIGAHLRVRGRGRLREFDHVSRVVGAVAALPVLAPVLVALAVEEAPLLAFAGRVAARRVALWALTHPAAALAASEVLLGFGVQIGEDGWQSFWERLQDPQGRWFVIAQVLLDYMHVKTAGSGHAAEPEQAPRTRAPDLDGAHLQVEQLRVILQRVHDEALIEAPGVAGRPNSPARPTVGSAAAHESAVTEEGAPTSRTLVVNDGNRDLRSQLPADLNDVEVTRSPQLRGNDVVVHYRDGAVHIEVGPTATARHVGYHIATVRSLLRFKGPIGYVRQLIDAACSKLRIMPGYGRAGFEARAEVKKLLEIERELTTLKTRLENGTHTVEQGRRLDATAIDTELAQVQEQLELEATRLDSYAPGNGAVAARSIPEYPIALDTVVATEDDGGGKQFTVAFTARTKDGVSISLGEGYVRLTPDGEPDGYPEFALGNYTHVQGVEHKVKLYPTVIEQSAGEVPLGQGKETALTRYAIDRFIQRYKARFGAEPAALGGSLAFENKKNFQIQYIKFMRQRIGRSAALKAAAAEISYGKHRIAAGYTELDVDPGPPRTWILMNLDDGTKDVRVPTIIKITARKP
jgi:hypothetical protein